VLAEAALGLEQELVVGVALAELRRLQRVGELAVEVLERAVDDLLGVDELRAPLAAERDGARVAALVQAQRVLLKPGESFSPYS
jgi:hypothetical protein